MPDGRAFRMPLAATQARVACALKATQALSLDAWAGACDIIAVTAEARIVGKAIFNCHLQDGKWLPAMAMPGIAVR
jgi:hypothetical protein